MVTPRIKRILTLCLILILGLTACGTQTAKPSASVTVDNTPTPSQPAAASPLPEATLAAVPTPDDLPSSAEFNLILGRPSANSIAASFYARTNMQVSLAYGTASGSTTEQSGPLNLQAGIPATIELNGLAANTTYYYTLSGRGVPKGEYRFQTQRPPGSAFTFTIDADPHNRDPRFNGELYTTTLNNAGKDRPDFHINLGDTFMTEKLKPQTYAEAESSFSDMRPYLAIVGMQAPLFLVNGNHEGEMGWLLGHGKDEALPLWSTQLRQAYYPNPIPGDFYSGSVTEDATLGSRRDGYYAWSWGDALFVTLDPYWYTTSKPKGENLNSNWNWSLGKAQYDWLKTTLESSPARFKFIFIHHLVGGDKDGRGGVEFAGLFEWGGNNADGSYGFDTQRPGWGKPIHQLLAENRVNAVFHGHDHVFVKQELDGIVYQEVPQPNNAEYNKTSLAADYGYTHGDVFGSSGHLRVAVTPQEVTVAYVRAYLPQDEKPGQQNGQVDYVYRLVPR